MKYITDIGNTRGFIYVTAPDGTTILSNLPNNADGYRQAKQLGLISTALTGEVLPHVEITWTATPTGDISAISINGVNQLGSTVVATNGDPVQTALDLRDNINAFAPAGPDYSAFVNGAQLMLAAPPGSGSGLNGLALTVTADAGITFTPEDPVVYGGSSPTDIFDPAFGYRFFLDANYGSGEISGQGVAVEGDLSNAVEITLFLVMRGLQAKLDTIDATLANDVLSFDRTMSVMTINVGTEGGAGADDIITIDSPNSVFGDVIILRAKVASEIPTLKTSTGTGENIFLQSAADFSLGAITRLIMLQYINDGGDAKWAETGRIPVLADTTISVAAMRSVNIPQPVSGTATTTLSNGGGTINLTPGTDKGYQILKGTVTLAGSYVVQGAGTPKDGDTFLIDYRALATVGANSITIFGIALTANMALMGRTVVIATYDSTLTGYRTIAVPSAEVAGWIEDSMIKAATITGDKLVDATIPNSKLATPPPATFAKEPLLVAVSFETGEIGVFYIKPNFAGTIDSIYGSVKKTLSDTNAGTVAVATAGGSIPETLSFPLSSAMGTAVSVTPSANYTFAANETIAFTTAKSNPGGRVELTLQTTRTS